MAYMLPTTSQTSLPRTLTPPSPNTRLESSTATRPVALGHRSRSYSKSWIKFPQSSAWEMSYHSINLLLNEADPDRQLYLTEKWLRNMEQHLNTTIITSAVISSVVCSSFSWATFGADHSDSTCIWLVKSIWFSALMFSVGSIASACQQIGCVHRLTSHPDGLGMMRRLLGEHNDEKQLIQVRLSQRLLWQIPAMLLNWSLYMFVAGLCLIFYWDVAQHLHDISLSLLAVILCLFTASFVFTIVCWGTSSIWLYCWVAQITNKHATVA